MTQTKQLMNSAFLKRGDPVATVGDRNLTAFQCPGKPNSSPSKLPMILFPPGFPAVGHQENILSLQISMKHLELGGTLESHMEAP